LNPYHALYVTVVATIFTKTATLLCRGDSRGTVYEEGNVPLILWTNGSDTNYVLQLIDCSLLLRAHKCMEIGWNCRIVSRIKIKFGSFFNCLVQ